MKTPLRGQSFRLGQIMGPAGRRQSIGQEARNSHWTHATRHRGDGRGNRCYFIVLYIPYQTKSGFLRLVSDAVDTDVNHYSAWLHHIGCYKFRLANGNNLERV